MPHVTPPSEDAFYVVLPDNDTRLVRHFHRPDARPPHTADVTALKAAQAHPGQKFYVLKVIRYAECAPPVRQPEPVMHTVDLPRGGAAWAILGIDDDDILSF